MRNRRRIFNIISQLKELYPVKATADGCLSDLQSEQKQNYLRTVVPFSAFPNGATIASTPFPCKRIKRQFLPALFDRPNPRFHLALRKQCANHPSLEPDPYLRNPCQRTYQIS